MKTIANRIIWFAAVLIVGAAYITSANSLRAGKPLSHHYPLRMQYAPPAVATRRAHTSHVIYNRCQSIDSTATAALPREIIFN